MAKTPSNSSAQDSLTPSPRPETQTVEQPAGSDTNSFARQSLEDSLAELSMEDRHPNEKESNGAWVAEEERRIEREIVSAICTGKADSLKPNSDKAITIGNHYVCVFRYDDGPDPNYWTWEWHGHVIRFNEKDGYTPEHIYGHHLEKMSWYDEEDEEEDGGRTTAFVFPRSFRRA